MVITAIIQLSVGGTTLEQYLSQALLKVKRAHAVASGNKAAVHEGGTMKPTFSQQEIEQLLAEADALIDKINSDALHDLEEAQRMQIEKQAQALKQLSAETQKNIAKTEKTESGTFGEGMHEAIDAIAKAMKNLGGLLS